MDRGFSPVSAETEYDQNDIDIRITMIKTDWKNKIQLVSLGPCQIAHNQQSKKKDHDQFSMQNDGFVIASILLNV